VTVEFLAYMDPETCPDGDMFDELLWFEITCRIAGKMYVTEEDARAFLRDTQKRPDLAEAFSTDYLFAVPLKT